MIVVTAEYLHQSVQPYRMPIRFAIMQALREFLAPACLSMATYTEEQEQDYSVSFQSDAAIQLLKGLYSLINPAEVRTFLTASSYLITPLLDAYEHINRAFAGDIVDILLRYDSDPEEDFECLTAIVETNLPADACLELLDQFDEDWWLDVDADVRMSLIITVRPR